MDFRKYALDKGVRRSVFDNYVKHAPANITPYITEERRLNVAQMDVFSRLMMDRIIFLGDAIDDDIANIVQAQLLFLQSNDSKADIQLYINSPGGSVYAGLGIYDTMQLVSPDVATICTGMAASMGAVLLCAGAEGKRAALTHSRVMIHQPSGGTRGVSKDMEIDLKEMQELRKDLYTILADHSGQTYEWVEEACDRDYWMRSVEAKEKGFIDEILTKKKK